MALKFLNKKGWHTGSLRNIENVWKAEQKHEAEQRKLDELRKQIHEEREKAEFRQLQEQAGLVPKQERLDFLYDSGLASRKDSSEGFKTLESLPPKAEPEASTSANKASAPGALFEDKPQSANDAWRKLHSDPLLLIKQREQEALARVKNNPVQMAMIRKSVEAKKKTSDEQKHKEKHHRKKSKHEKYKHRSGSEETGRQEEDRVKSAARRSPERHHREDRKHRPPAHHRNSNVLSNEDRARKLKEMQMDAELHEEQRWKRLKQAEDEDAKEVSHASSGGRNFLDAAHKSIYGAEKGGSSTIEESVRRRTHYSQRKSEGNAFRR
ncbi:hypothetical protein L2E82_15426 [Cichorium intybus]|uniref:Uncharacterized protein n=1 Tax=Cichorium intybus TaxID=13427 RepID=A0ACB9F3P6_CICIN|nr:hypothetical protein L2E82_15426 [Cichorium intybus]